MSMDWFRLVILYGVFFLSACGGGSSETSLQNGNNTPLNPAGIATDGANLYVTDNNNTIRKVNIATGNVTTLAGTPGVHGSTDGPGVEASFYSPQGIVVVGPTLYVLDTLNGTIRKIEIATGRVSRFAGDPRLQGGSFDGTGTSATFNLPTEITTDGTNLYVADNQGDTIRKIVLATAEVTTLTSSHFYGGGIAVAGTSIYVANAPSISKVSTDTGTVSSLIINTGTVPPVVNPSGMISDGISIYFADSYDHTIKRAVIASGLVTSLAGSAGATSSVDGTGAAARFKSPSHITSDGMNLYVTDDQLIRKVVISTGEVTTLATQHNQ